MAPRLRVSAGPSVDKLSLIRVNDEDHPLTIKTDDFVGRLTVRIQGFTGIRPGANDEDEAASDVETHYFEHSYAKGCTWSIQVQGKFKEEISVDNLMYGNQFDKPIRDRLPWGTSVALRAINIIDPNLQHDLYADQPWAFGPLVTSMTRVNVERKQEEPAEDFKDWPAFPAGRSEDDYVQEDTSVLLCKNDKGDLLEEIEENGFADSHTLTQLKDTASGHTHRARLWGNQSVRQAGKVTPNDIVSLAFDNGFIDFNTLRVVLPYTGGMGFDLQKYWMDNRFDIIAKMVKLERFQIVEKDE
ncbi:hypothetical protein L7F22_018977 [Adiantum nelumboides]|nr:hypothetical protein [Adiantum nelumboides]